MNKSKHELNPYKPEPYKKKKFVVHKPVFRKAYIDDNEILLSD